MLVHNAQQVGSREEAIRTIKLINPKTTVLMEHHQPATAHYPGSFQEVAVTNNGDEIEAFFDAGQGAFFVLSEWWYPGWIATDNGRPVVVHEVNGGFRGLEVGPGRHFIKLVYRPWSYIVGKWLTISGLIIVFLVFSWPSTLIFKKCAP